MGILPTLRRFMHALLHRGPAEPEDPYARVRVPVRRGPPGRAAAVALEEPEEKKRLNVFGRRIPKPES
jgi:hypothetical protein